ncbi:MAG: hypothetical protein IT233_10215 [Bacteroidia bacterium]|nr:hypothetical protein [Bacteroidia bacterium]
MVRLPALLLILALSAGPVFAQKTKAKKGPKTGGSFLSKLDRKYAKYFAALGAGKGKSYWNSELGNTLIYDLSGASYASGNIKFRTSGVYDNYFLDVCMPISTFRLGIGINFQYHYIDRLTLEQATGDKIILYSESFRMDKIYVQYEVPFAPKSEHPLACSLKGHIGYFGVSFVDHHNFFGEEALAQTWFFTMGLLPDFKLYPHTYVFLFPHLEFTYFNNSKAENPSEIKHRIFQWNVSAGIRVDISKE